MPRISDDLVMIRKEMRLNKQNVYEKCRVPLETIYAIEDGTIFTGKTLNKTYLRSYFRTYAKAIGISDEDITRALDEHEEGRYEGSLADKYLPGEDTRMESETGEQPTAEDSSNQTEGSGTASETIETESGKDSSDETGKKAGQKDYKSANRKKSKIITPESQEKTIEDVEWEDESLNKTPSTSTSDFASYESHDPDPIQTVLPEPPDVHSVDWATKVKQAIYRPQRNRLLWVIIAIILALALAIASVYWFWQRQEDPLTMDVPAGEAIPGAPSDDITISEDEFTTEISPDPAGAPDTVAETQPEMEMILEESEDTGIESDEEADTSFYDPAVITTRATDFTDEEDTIDVFVYALHGNLEPIRVHSDLFVDNETETTALRPYWVEHQEAMRFGFSDEIILQGTLSRMVLIVNGHIIEDFENLYMNGPRIHLTREFLADNERFHNPATSPFSEIPEPVAVVSRPTFSP